jgi:heme oxygenase
MEEEFLKHKDHPILGPVYFPKELNRAETLKKDIDFYLGENWKEANPISPGIQHYVDSIKADSESHPHRLIAHSYTRYLGDLSGGQMMSRKVKKNYSLESDEGVQFFLFEHIESPKNFKEMYRQKLDEIEIDLDTKSKLNYYFQIYSILTLI